MSILALVSLSLQDGLTDYLYNGWDVALFLSRILAPGIECSWNFKWIFMWKYGFNPGQWTRILCPTFLLNVTALRGCLERRWQDQIKGDGNEGCEEDWEKAEEKDEEEAEETNAKAIEEEATQDADRQLQ